MKAIINGILFMVIALTGCQSAEKAEGEQAEVIAAEMMGRRAAKPIVNATLSDSVKIKEDFRKANDLSVSYKKEGKPQDAAKFDSAFYSTIRKIAPEMLFLDPYDRRFR